MEPANRDWTFRVVRLAAVKLIEAAFRTCVFIYGIVKVS
jgi:hypothetical protein